MMVEDLPVPLWSTGVSFSRRGARELEELAGGLSFLAQEDTFSTDSQRGVGYRNRVEYLSAQAKY